MTNKTEPKNATWEMKHIPQHVVMEMWCLKGTETCIFWGINLHADGEENSPYWVEYYPHYTHDNMHQECTSQNFQLYADVVIYLQELMDMSDEEYIDKSFAQRNDFINHVAEMMIDM